MSYATLNAERAWLDRERVANAWDADRLIAWLGPQGPGRAGAGLIVDDAGASRDDSRSSHSS